MSQQTGDGLDLREKSRTADGQLHTLDRRLFMQLLVFGECSNPDSIIEDLEEANLPAVLYLDASDPWGVGLLTFSEDPDFFVTDLREFFRISIFNSMVTKPELTMIGRTYAIGYEPDLEQALITRPRQKICDPATPWAIWYPLRRAGAFENLPADEQRIILAEHGGIGRAYGRAGYGTDIRLASHGLDRNDNDFTVALIGPQLYPLSSVVQRMRKTQQTSRYLERIGPFFVGKAIWRNEGI